MILLVTSALASPPVVASGVLGAASAAYTPNGVGAPSVQLDPTSGQLVMVFETMVGAPGCDEAWAVGIASSPDGLMWTVRPSALVRPTAGTAWECGARHPALLRTGGAWILAVNVLDGASDDRVAIGRILRGGAALHDMPGLTGLRSPSISARPGAWLVVGVSAEAGAEGLRFAHSTDGVTWTQDATAALPQGVTPYTLDTIGSPTVRCREADDYVWGLSFGGAGSNEQGLGQAVSRDAGFWFVAEPEARWNGATWIAWDTLLAGQQQVYFFEELDAAGLSQISVATTNGEPFAALSVARHDCRR